MPLLIVILFAVCLILLGAIALGAPSKPVAWVVIGFAVLALLLYILGGHIVR